MGMSPSLQPGTFLFSNRFPTENRNVPVAARRIHCRTSRFVIFVGLMFSLGFAEPEEQPVKATLIAEHASIRPGGATRIGVLFDIEEGWHIYAEDPGDAGLPTKVEFSGPPVVQFGPVQYPPPTAFNDPGDIETFGYSRAVVLASRLTVEA